MTQLKNFIIYTNEDVDFSINNLIVRTINEEAALYKALSLIYHKNLKVYKEKNKIYADCMVRNCHFKYYVKPFTKKEIKDLD
tara:strand:+ start:108 stop:353 length:246 start_codon:yes stop_codon:yes gene_type:complete